jgi:hypothetical protein
VVGGGRRKKSCPTFSQSVDENMLKTNIFEKC